jgi:hypothetical protein
MEPQLDNPTGFWEAREISRFNERLLRHLGGSWDAPPELSVGWSRADELHRWKAEAVTLVDEVRSDGGACHAIKDPRIYAQLVSNLDHAAPEQPGGIPSSTWPSNTTSRYADESLDRDPIGQDR